MISVEDSKAARQRALGTAAAPSALVDGPATVGDPSDVKSRGTSWESGGSPRGPGPARHTEARVRTRQLEPAFRARVRAEAPKRGRVAERLSEDAVIGEVLRISDLNSLSHSDPLPLCVEFP